MNAVHYVNIDYKTENMRKKKWILLLCVLASASVEAQTADPLPGYIAEGLSKNLVLQEKSITLEKSLLVLKEARSLYLPTSYFETQYTLAQGGRAIEFPVGDLLNPVYTTLNQLTNSSQFPQVKNVSEQFLPNNFYDVRIKTSMPVINTDLKYNKQIKEQQHVLDQTGIDQYRRELIKEIKTAFYSYQLATEAQHIYENALVLVQQNLRQMQSLLANGKGLPAYVSRASSELKNVETQVLNASNERMKARAYFNFLLNKPLTDSIQTITPTIPATVLLEETGTVTNREELKALQTAKQVYGIQEKMYKSFRTPKLNAFVDLAAQGFNFKVTNKSFFYLGGIQFSFPIFTGSRNLYKIEGAKIEQRAIELRSASVRQQLELAAFTSRSNALTSYNNYTASLLQQEAAQQYFKLIDRGYKEGVNSFIEFLDARNQLTTAQLQVSIQQYRYLAALANYERETASYTIN